MYFLKKKSSLLRAMVKTNKMLSYAKEGSTKTVNFYDSGGGIFVLGRGHINHTENGHY